MMRWQLPVLTCLHLASLSFSLRRTEFPPSFLFGASTSSYQIEGAYLEDNKSLSNWDVFTHTPGHVYDGSNGDEADDHYHRFMEDVELMRSLGINSYRFSIAWARILPGGKAGGVNLLGIAFYNKLIDALLERGIAPFVTLCHFDIPQEFEDRFGAWLGPQIQEEFGYYADVCFEEFGDRVKHWVTINEPNLMAKYGYGTGVFPPHRCSAPFGDCTAGDSTREPYVAVHNIILAHAIAVQIYRTKYQAEQGGVVGCVVSAVWYEPLSSSAAADLAAARRQFVFDVAWVLDPLVYGDYPCEMRRVLGSKLPRFSLEEKNRLLQSRIDFIGINHFTSLYAEDCVLSPCARGVPTDACVVTSGVKYDLENRTTTIGKPTPMENLYVFPQGMERIVTYVMKRYDNLPMYITENGFPQQNDPNASPDEFLNDTERVDYLESYLSSLNKAIRGGADVRGYFVWSIIDNFEWYHGFTMRFGLYHVNFETQARIPRLSVGWYQTLLNASPKHLVQQA